LLRPTTAPVGAERRIRKSCNNTGKKQINIIAPRLRRKGRAPCLPLLRMLPMLALRQCGPCCVKRAPLPCKIPLRFIARLAPVLDRSATGAAGRCSFRQSASMKAWLSKPARVRARVLAEKQQGRGTAPAERGAMEMQRRARQERSAGFACLAVYPAGHAFCHDEEQKARPAR